MKNARALVGFETRAVSARGARPSSPSGTRRLRGSANCARAAKRRRLGTGRVPWASFTAGPTPAALQQHQQQARPPAGRITPPVFVADARRFGCSSTPDPSPATDLKRLAAPFRSRAPPRPASSTSSCLQPPVPMPPPSGEQQKQPARSTPSSSRPAPLFIPASLSRLSFQVAPEPASPPDADGERWSDIPILLDDGGGPSLAPSAPCASQNTPRQILHFPTDVFVDDSDGAPLSSPHGACGTPRGLPTSRAAAGRAAVASSSVEPPTAEHLDPTCLLADTDAGSDSDSSSRSAPSMHVVSDDHGLADAAPAALSRRNRLAYGPEADLWRQCSLLRPVFEPSFPSGLGLFDPEYDLRRVVPAAASMQRGSSPFGTSIDDDDQSEEILTVNEGRRCPSPLDSTYLAVLSRPPVNPDRALFNSEMAARSAAKGELRVLIWLGESAPPSIRPGAFQTDSSDLDGPLFHTRTRRRVRV